MLQDVKNQQQKCFIVVDTRKKPGSVSLSPEIFRKMPSLTMASVYFSRRLNTTAVSLEGTTISSRENLYMSLSDSMTFPIYSPSLSPTRSDGSMITFAGVHVVGEGVLGVGWPVVGSIVGSYVGWPVVEWMRELDLDLTDFPLHL